MMYGDIQRTVEGHHYSHETGGDDPVKLTQWDVGEIGDIIIKTVMPDPIPAGWELIATDRMLMGAGSLYAPGDLGGAATAAISSHAGAAVSAHAGAAVSAHSGAAVANHSDHAHTTSGLTVQSGLGADPANHADTGGSLSTLTHSVTQPSNHTVTQPNNHTVTQPDDHNTVATVPPFYAVYFFLRVY